MFSDLSLPRNTPRGVVLHRRRTVELGMPSSLVDQLVRSRRWSRILPEVYFAGPLPTGSVPLSNLRIQAAGMWADDGYAVARTAAAWWNSWLPTPPEVVELLVTPDRRLSPQPGFRVVRAELDPLDLTVHRGVVTTAAPRTALDLAANGSTDLLDVMLREGWFDPAALDGALARGRGRRGWILARESLAECAYRPFSAAERRMHRALRAAGIDGWQANPTMAIAGTIVKPDLLFEKRRLVVEIDGHEHHSDRDAFERDRHRQNLLVGAGYRVLRFTWRQLVEDPDGVIRAIVAELRRAG